VINVNKYLNYTSIILLYLVIKEIGS